MLRATNINENFLKQVRTISFISDPSVNIYFVRKHYSIYFEYSFRLLMIVINDTDMFSQNLTASMLNEQRNK